MCGTFKVFFRAVGWFLHGGLSARGPGLNAQGSGREESFLRTIRGSICDMLVNGLRGGQPCQDPALPLSLSVCLAYNARRDCQAASLPCPPQPAPTRPAPGRQGGSLLSAAGQLMAAKVWLPGLAARRDVAWPRWAWHGTSEQSSRLVQIRSLTGGRRTPFRKRARS